MSKEEQDKDAIIAELIESNAQLTAKVERLQSMLDAAIKMLHGSKSEKLDPAQLELLLDPEAAKKPDAADCDQDAPAADSRRRSATPSCARVLKPCR